MAGGARPAPPRPEAAQKQARPSCPSGAAGARSLLGSQLALACPAGPRLCPRAPVGRRPRAAHPLQYQDPCAQTEKGTSQLALPTAAVGERVLQAPPQPTWTPAPRDHAWGVAGVGPDAGHAVKERGWFHSGHRRRGTTWPVSGLPVGFLVRKQVSLEHGSVRCPEAEIPHSTPCLFRGFWSSNLPRGWRGSSGALRRRCRCCSSADPSAPAASGSLWKCVF